MATHTQLSHLSKETFQYEPTFLQGHRRPGDFRGSVHVEAGGPLRSPTQTAASPAALPHVPRAPDTLGLKRPCSFAPGVLRPATPRPCRAPPPVWSPGALRHRAVSSHHTLLIYSALPHLILGLFIFPPSKHNRKPCSHRRHSEYLLSESTKACVTRLVLGSEHSSALTASSAFSIRD